MTYKCCICGKIYNNENSVVKCVNKCAREMHKKGVFETKSVYSEGQTIIEYSFETKNKADLRQQCENMIKNIGLAAQNSFKNQLENWNKLTEGEQIQLYDMIKMIAGV